MPEEYVAVSGSDKDENGGVQAQNNAPVSVSIYRIYALCIINFGLSASWTLKMAVTTPYFASVLNSGPVLSHLVWILGPIAGLIVAPIVGNLSDKLGKRRPFLVVGACGTCVAMLIFPNVPILGLPEKPAQAVAVAAFALMNFSVNTSMFPARALQGDLVPKHQQHTVQSASLVMAAAGDFLINGLLQLFPNPVTHIGKLFAIAAAIYVSSTAILLAISPAESSTTKISLQRLPLSGQGSPRSRMNINNSICNNLSDLLLTTFRSIKTIPIWLWRIGGVYAFGFAGFFVMLPNFTQWLGTSVLGGDPNAAIGTVERAKYDMGVHAVGKSGPMRAFLAVLVALTYPKILPFTGARNLLAAAFGTYGVIALSLAGTQSTFLAQLMVAAYALPLTILLTLPVAIVVRKSTIQNRGKNLGLLNLFSTVPQLLDTTYTGYVSKHFGESVVMRIGAVWSLLAALFAMVFVKS